MTKRNETGIVYSTTGGKTCPRCGKAGDGCACGRTGKKNPPPGLTFPDDGIVRIRREVKGRKGKGVTTIHGLPLGPADLQALGSELKRRCGTGGTVKNGVVEIQGDHRDFLLEELGSLGYRVKKAGG